MSKEGEEALLKFWEMKKKIQEAEEKLKELIKEKMDAEKIVKVEGEKVKIIKRAFGSKYKVIEPEVAKQLGFGKVKEYVYPDNEKIELFLESEGCLPEGIIENKRDEQVVISLINENED
ncbi:MAG: hypothetical protein NC935_08390 [Candidatus Omnitrophica bacterium]|nr:hypothetical protein [Candidatus Omnitrophota bacterium]